jgi:GDP-L-fucose synthase
MLPALVRKFHEAKVKGDKDVTVWGTGQVYRELLYVDDLAEACVLLMERYNQPEFINAGYGEDFTVAAIAQMVREAVGYTGGIVYDTAKPDGMYRKLMDSAKIRGLGWAPAHTLAEGIRKTYDWYRENH